ncbi:DUF1707 domain-containing protein [Saccharopolyspora indica]|uniref:DUF1707 SHOCT-like domain-containing protein n=1 Tax=Saccharopolyspora indica TaxID=1229659 RepID=UPI0022EA7C30|nr:DUF1707 domain-containing protein [Saccharopolyspora indica]MDA3644814.1 DUF1707 domain-containing protein [Saccharopolyspora indica]
MTGADSGAMRASDGDREAVAQRLRAALDEGRLTLPEYDERLQQAFAATTYGELAPLTSDLPEAAPPKPSKQVAKREKRKRKQIKEWRDWGGTGVILVGIWLVTSIASGAATFFWPMIPLGIWAAVILADLVFGSGGKSERSED